MKTYVVCFVFRRETQVILGSQVHPGLQELMAFRAREVNR